MGSGSGAMILETLENAEKRNAKIYAEIIGCHSNSNAFHITSPDAEGKMIQQCMEGALARANISPEQVDSINAHATSTPVGDKIESIAIKEMFSKKRIPVTSNKGSMGHTLGASGMLESIFSALSIQNSLVPHTLHLEELDPNLPDLHYVADKPLPYESNVILKNSFGFGGINCSLVFKKFES